MEDVQYGKRHELAKLNLTCDTLVKFVYLTSALICCDDNKVPVRESNIEAA